MACQVPVKEPAAAMASAVMGLAVVSDQAAAMARVAREEVLASGRVVATVQAVMEAAPATASAVMGRVAVLEPVVATARVAREPAVPASRVARVQVAAVARRLVRKYLKRRSCS
jgi:hypothetical protein